MPTFDDRVADNLLDRELVVLISILPQVSDMEREKLSPCGVNLCNSICGRTRDQESPYHQERQHTRFHHVALLHSPPSTLLSMPKTGHQPGRLAPNSHRLRCWSRKNRPSLASGLGRVGNRRTHAPGLIRMAMGQLSRVNIVSEGGQKSYVEHNDWRPQRLSPIHPGQTYQAAV